MGSLGPQRLLAIIETQTAIASVGPDLDAVLALVLERARALTGAGSATVELFQDGEMVHRLASGMAAPDGGLSLDEDSSRSGRCLVEERVLHCRGAEQDPRVDREAARGVGAASLLCVPLSHGGESVGVLKVCHARPNAFGERDKLTLDLLSRLIAAAMANAQAFELQRHESRHDVLTGLPNRRAFEEQLESEIARGRRYGGTLTVGLIDLDGFKAINDRCGHGGGDEVLRAVAAHLARLRGADRAFRFGGDEFVVIFPGADVAGARGAMTRVQRSVRQDPACRGTGFSWGLAELSEHAQADTLLAAADSALYEAKRLRSSRAQVTARRSGAPVAAHH
jgi:diguanylate cyclase (GGDEF)-like protein